MKGDENNKEQFQEHVFDANLDKVESDERRSSSVLVDTEPNAEVDSDIVPYLGNNSSPIDDSGIESTSEDAHSGDDEHENFTHDGDEFGYEPDDPLAPAYDLERGTPLGNQTVEEQIVSPPWKSKIKTAKEFFNTEILYRFDILTDEERQALFGTYRVELKGYQGGVWSIRIDDNIDVVNRREETDIVLTMQQKDFLPLVNGQFNPQLAIFAQKLRISGDIKKAVLFQALLVPQSE